ncbi:MAG: TonB-dependent receptor [Steroidobacteraceae bacterium]
MANSDELLVTVMACLTGIFCPALAVAQTVASSGDSHGVLEEIVVTSQRRAENLQNVPIAVTAITGETLKQQSIRDTSDLQRLTPSLSIAANVGRPNNALISLRGQVQPDTTVTLDPSVGIYFDDVYQGRAQGSLTELYDIERIEVLRGPQGTLYGRNTTGGAIKVVTKQADPSGGISGYASLGYGNFDSIKVEGGVNLPIVAERLAVRFSGDYHTRDGYTKTVITDGATQVPTGQVMDTDDLVFKSGRANVLWRASDAVTVTVSGDYTDIDTHGAYAQNRVGGDVVGPGNVLSRSSSDFYTARSNVVPDSDTRVWGVSAATSVDLGATSAKLTVAHRDVRNGPMAWNIDGTGAALIEQTLELDGKQDSAEFQVSGRSESERLNWVAGLYYFDETARDQTHATLFGGALRQVFDGTADNRSESVFAHVIYKLTDELRLTLGGRYTQDKKAFDARNRVGGNCPYLPDSPGFNAADCSLTRSDKFDYPSWNAGLDYDLTDAVLLYVRAGRGQRSGGQQVRAIGTDPVTGLDTTKPYDPEQLTDAEIGIKSELFDQRVRLNADYYYAWYKDAQGLMSVILSTGATLSLTTNNEGTSKVQGVELEGLIRATDRLGFSLAGSYTHFESGNPAIVPVYLPKYKASTGANYTVPTSFGNWQANLNYSYQSSRYIQPQRAAAMFNKVDAVDLFDARLAVKLDGPQLTIAAWAKNILDKEYFSSGARTPLPGFPIAPGGSVAGEPRTYGVTFSKEF